MSWFSSNRRCSLPCANIIRADCLRKASTPTLRHTPKGQRGQAYCVCPKCATQPFILLPLFKCKKYERQKSPTFLEINHSGKRKKEIFTKKKNDQFCRRIMSCHDSTERDRNRERITAEAQKRINFILLRSLFIHASEFQRANFYFREIRNFQKRENF